MEVILNKLKNKKATKGDPPHPSARENKARLGQGNALGNFNCYPKKRQISGTKAHQWNFWLMQTCPLQGAC